MNCRDIEPLLLAERDGMLTPGQHAALADHVATCPACRKERMIYGEAVTLLKTETANVPVPDVDNEWRKLRALIGKPAKKRPLAPVIWFAVPLAAAAAFALSFFNDHSAAPAPVSRIAVAPKDPTGPGTPTVAYVDQDSGWLVVWAADADAKKSG
jgi:anti-sigma factor RsiW